MSTLASLLSTARHLALVALVGAALVLTACGGGGGKHDVEVDEDGNVIVPPPVTDLVALGMAELDGSVFGDNLQVQSRPDLQPAVGDFAFQQGVTAGSARSIAYYSFDISAIPAGSTVKSATLRLFNRAIQGDPQATTVLIRVDHVNYGTVFPQALLGGQTLDSNFATIADIGTTGEKLIDVKEQLQADVDAGRPRSQYRLRGALASNLDNLSDLAFLTDAEDSFGTGQVPMIVIELE